MRHVGEKVKTDILLRNTSGEEVVLSKIKNKFTLIYFYPKDNTPGCSIEACSFRDMNSEIESLGVKVIGISADSPESHQSFSEKHSLNFELWCDEGRELMKEFDVLKEKKRLGHNYQSTERSTFLIDREGVILRKWEKVNPLTHSKEVYEYLSSLFYKVPTAV